VKGEQIERRWHGVKPDKDFMETVGVAARSVREVSLLAARSLVFRCLWLKDFLYLHPLRVLLTLNCKGKYFHV
jgi:hypothetical protein